MKIVNLLSTEHPLEQWTGIFRSFDLQKPHMLEKTPYPGFYHLLHDLSVVLGNHIILRSYIV